MAAWPVPQLQESSISSFLLQAYSPGERQGPWTLYTPAETCGSRTGSENLLSPGSQNSQNPKTQLACHATVGLPVLGVGGGTHGREREVRSGQVLIILKASVGAESPPPKVVCAQPD